MLIAASPTELAGVQSLAEQAETTGDVTARGTIAFSSVAPRGWDLYQFDLTSGNERQITDHQALDYNAAISPVGHRVAFVSERHGNLELYLLDLEQEPPALTRLTDEFALDDHPAWSPDGQQMGFCSTREAAETPGQAWNAVYVMRVGDQGDGSATLRLTPPGTADYSPAWSPDGQWIAVASGSGRSGGTDLYVMRPDGSERRMVVRNGGWPAFSSDSKALYFHSRRDNRWGIWQVQLDGANLQRLTPGDVEAYTPRTSPNGEHLVIAVQRGNYRQLAMIDPNTRELRQVTTANADHWNPTISNDGTTIIYHRRSAGFTPPEVETWSAPPDTDLRMLRMTGSFPAIAPDGKRMALIGTGFSSLDVMNVDGTSRQTIYRGAGRDVFSVSWAKQGGDLIAFSLGPTFQGPAAGVDIGVIQPDGEGFRSLTSRAGNSAFPSFSPDGEQLVFRSGRDGAKNLYTMDRYGGNVARLTEGNWTDTMCHWSPTGAWIVFASDRGGSFELWLIRPDGSELQKLIGGGGRHNHPHFSPCSQWVVFTSQRAGYSAEEISLPRQPQPYGSLFMVRIDGSGLTRLTHNGFEEGTPDWCN